jgi:flagellar biosynthesis/type III secretory pathway protein FliH
MRRLTSDHCTAVDAPARLALTPAAAPTSAATADPEAALRARAERELAAAREQGKAAGLKDAEAEIARRVDAVTAKLHAEHDAAIGAVRDERKRLRALSDGLEAAVAAHGGVIEHTAAEIAYAAVVRLLGARVAERQLIADLCRAVLHDYGGPQAVLRLGEADMARLPDGVPGVTVEVDRRLGPGQCVIVTARGQFESGIDVRLERLRRALLDTLAGEGT